MNATFKLSFYMLLFLFFLFMSSFANWEPGGRRVPAAKCEDSSIVLDTLLLNKEAVLYKEVVLDSGLITNSYCHSDSLPSDTTDSYQKLNATGVSILKTPKVWGSNHDTILLNTLMYNRQNLESIEFFNEENNAFIHHSFNNPYSFGASLWLIIPSVITTAILFLYTDLVYIENVSKPDENETAILICGFAGCGISFSFGTAKMINHFNWKNRYGE